MADGDNSIESWRTIEGFADYEVSDLGRVRRTTSMGRYEAGRLLSPWIAGKGYETVRLVAFGASRSMYVHRLVAAAFCGRCPTGCEVNHIDGIKTHNIPSNLEYVTSGGNIRHAYKLGLRPSGDRHNWRRERGLSLGEKNTAAKLTGDDVRRARAMRKAGATCSSIAEAMGVSRRCIGNATTGKSWRHIS